MTSQPTPRYAGRHRIADHHSPSVPGYDCTELLGAGGSGAVWAATDSEGVPVAIKVVAADQHSDALNELAVIGRIREDHLVNFRTAIGLPNGDIALVLDRLDGGSLAAIVRDRGHLSAGEVVTALSPIATVLGRLHARGVVHGDISAGNVLFDGAGRPHLADLGVARICGEHIAQVRGTEGFVAPEVMAGGQPTAASDVYALGSLAWMCLAGAAPGPAAMRGELGERVAGVPAALAQLVGDALRTVAEERPSADEFAERLFACASAEPIEPVTGIDDIAMLTRRIRAAAAPEVPSSEPTKRGGLRGWWRRQRTRKERGAVERLKRRDSVSLPPPPASATSAALPQPGPASVKVAAPHPAANPPRPSSASAPAAAARQARLVSSPISTPAAAPDKARGAGMAARVAAGADSLRQVAASRVPRPDRQVGRGRRLIMVVAVGVAAVLCFGGVAALVTGRDGDRPTRSTSAEPASAGAREASEQEQAADRRLDPEAPQEHPLALAESLARARATAWSSGVAARLIEVDAPRSPALAADTAVLADVQRNRQRYVGLSFTVKEARFVGAQGDVHTIQARIDTSAHIVRGPRGDIRRPAVPGEPVLLDLTRTTSGWRVHEVRAL